MGAQSAGWHHRGMITSTAVTPTTADWITAWATVVAAVGGLAGFIALVIELWRRRGKRKRPPVGLLGGLLWLDESLRDIAALNGRESFWFLEAERRRQETLLAALNGQVVDDLLNKLVGEARAGYNSAFALAPGHGTKESTANIHRIQQQVELAQDAQTMCRKAIDRANTLIREHPL
jgi:hypothetical protein